MNNNEKILWPGWETGRLIGRGSFGSVYEIQRQIFDEVEKAALKVISIPQNASDVTEMYNDGYDTDSITETFKAHLKSIVAEYSLMRKMNGCSNIVNCDDVRYVQHEDGIGWDIFIKMELLTPLTETLTNIVPEETVVRIASDICSALVLCSKHEIVHRDIKPQNIFVSPNGDYKLGDFGIAKTVEKTTGGTKIGTYKYMAPEVYHSLPYGSSADIYSLGLVLYWLLNERRMPFMPPPPAKLMAGQDEDARNRRLSGEQIPPPAHGSEKLKQIVLKACAYEPNQRYASAAEMLDELNALGIVEKSAVQDVAEKVVSAPIQEVAKQDTSEQITQAKIAPIYNEDKTVRLVHNAQSSVQPTPASQTAAQPKVVPPTVAQTNAAPQNTARPNIVTPANSDATVAVRRANAPAQKRPPVPVAQNKQTVKQTAKPNVKQNVKQKKDKKPKTGLKTAIAIIISLILIALFVVGIIAFRSSKIYIYLQALLSLQNPLTNVFESILPLL